MTSEERLWKKGEAFILVPLMTPLPLLFKKKVPTFSFCPRPRLYTFLPTETADSLLAVGIHLSVAKAVPRV